MRSLVLFFSLLLAFSATATHIIGGELFYDHLGGDQYRVTLKLFRDCGPGNANNTQYDPSVIIGVFGGDGSELANQTLNFPGAGNVPVILDNPCLTVPPSVCVEIAIYTGVFTLPARPDGYHLTYQRCCRSPTIVNIPNAADLGLTCTVRIPGGAPANSSARFTDYPPIALCLDEELEFDHSATDADGDSLVYELCTPFTGGLPTDPAPVPAPPPYTEVSWGPGYSEAFQMDGAPALQIDAATGLLTVRPTVAASYTVAIRVKEYRDGLLLSETRRDFRFDVVPCQTEITAIIGPQTADEFCAGLSIDFENESPTGTTWAWDFGDPNSTNDLSTESDPGWTYSGPGTYVVTLVANPGTVCADTTEGTFVLQVPPAPLFAVPDTICGDLLTEFVAGGTFSTAATFLWDFGSASQPSTSTAQVVSVQMPPLGSQIVTLTVNDGGCVGSASNNVVVDPQPDAFFTVAPPSPQAYGVNPFFTDASAWNGAEPGPQVWRVNGMASGSGSGFAWESPLPGVYTIQLVITSADGCTSSHSMPYEITAIPILVPNVMTPNQDGSNDRFFIANIEQHTNELSVFNRWGTKVYETSNYRNQWAAPDVPDGTYYYELLLGNGEVHAGHLTILR